MLDVFHMKLDGNTRQWFVPLRTRGVSSPSLKYKRGTNSRYMTRFFCLYIICYKLPHAYKPSYFFYRNSLSRLVKQLQNRRLPTHKLSTALDIIKTFVIRIIKSLINFINVIFYFHKVFLERFLRDICMFHLQVGPIQ